MSKFLQKVIFIIISVIVGNTYAQNCDVNTQKSLEQTQVSYFNKVTQGDNAVFTIRYPLIGTTYIISDNLGATYSFTYTSGTDEFINVNAGAVNNERRFSLKAQKGTCVYQTGFNYTVTPATSLQLVTRVEHERCGNGGAIRFTFVGPGANNNNYNFYIKKDTDANFDTSTPLPLTGAQSRAAGKYYIMARPKVGTGDIITPVIEIKKDIKNLDYTIAPIPVTCASPNLGIKAEIKVDQWGNHSANYPVYYSLLDASDNPIAGKQRQTSNIFTNLTPGTYKVKVEDFCGSSPTPQAITLTNATLTFTHLQLTSVREFSCDYADFNKLYLYGTNITEATKSDAFPYPFTIKFGITAPSGIVYSATYTITDRTDLDTYIGKYAYGEALVLTNNLREQRIPKEYGVWTVTAQITVCSTTTTIGTATSTLYNPIENARVVQTAGGNSLIACHKERLILTNKYRRDTSPILNTYLVVEQAPTNFKYAEAGFYQINTTNPLLSGKYLKQVLYDPWQDTEVVAPDFIHAGDVFQFRLVDATCSSTRSSLMDTITITIASVAQPTEITIDNIASCKDATKESAPYASMRIRKGSGSPIEKIQIVAFNGRTIGSIPSTTLSLPYTLTENNRADETNWYVRDLPAGSYTVVVTNICGGVVTKTKVLSGQTYTLTFAPGCDPRVVGQINLAATDDWRYTQSEFIIQHFNETTQRWDEWMYAGLNFNTPISRKTEDESLGKEGKFRVIRRIQNLAGAYECVLVLDEKEFGGDLKKPDLVGFGCGGGQYHIAVIPKGGTGPFTYKLVHKVPGGSTTPIPINQTQSGNNFFIGLDGSNPNTAYKFTITDACPRTEDREVTIANVTTPTIIATKRYHCVGQPAQLSVPNLGPSVTIEWYRSDAPTTLVATGTTLNITSLTTADFTNSYSVQLKIPSQPTIETCISNAIAAYQFQQLAVSIPTIPANNGETYKCIAQDEEIDLNTIFNIPALPTGVATRITETTGEITVPRDGKLKLILRGGYNKPQGIGSYTFRYELLSPCGEVERYQEAKLTVKRYMNYNPKTTIKVCNTTVSLNEIKNLVTAGTPTITTVQPEFHWYTSYADALAETSELAGATLLSTPSGSSQIRYLRLSKANYCNDGIYTITIQAETSVTAKTLTNAGCDVTTIEQLKNLVDPADAENVIIYKNGIAQANEATIETNTGYTYAKNVYECVTAPAALTFNLTPRVQAQSEQAKVCTYIGYYAGLITKVIDVKNALMLKYPTATAIRIFDENKSEYTNLYSEISLETKMFFKLQEIGKCESIFYPVVATMSSTTEVQTHSITICEQITAGELATQLQDTYGYTNVQIHEGRGTSVKAPTDFVDWNSSLYFSAEETGKCRSVKVPLILIKNANVTTATAKTFQVCRVVGNNPYVSDLKNAITGGEVKIFIRNGTQWQLQANTAQVDPTKSYFYTLQAVGKCPSEKTPLIVSLLDKPSVAPTVSSTVILCPTATSNVVSLTAYVTPLVGHTLRWYATATATVSITTPTINTQVTTKTTVTAYVVQVNASGCESPRAVVTVTVDDTATPTLIAPTPLVVNCQNATASITQWLGTASATDSCGTVSLTNNYTAPANLCIVPNGLMTVTFTATDLFGKKVTKNSTITLISIIANTDTLTIANGANGGTTNSVLTNDSLNGHLNPSTSSVTLTWLTVPTGVQTHTDGTLTVPAGTASGTYTVTYQICTTVSATTACSSATATIVVGAPAIIANTDTLTIANGANGGTTNSVLTNDSLNGHLNPSTNSVTLTWLTVPSGVQTHTDGTLTVPAGTASGTYTVTYSICEKLNPSNCSTATATIVVGAPAIIANTDTLTIANGANGGTTNSVLTNDSLNGHLNPSTSSVTLTWLTVPTGVQTHTDGTLTVPAGTASGTYTVTYSICEKLNPSNCSTATATIVVGAPAIIANTDTLTIANGANGGTTNSVLTNDSLNGHLNPSTTSVTLTWLTVPTGVQTHTDGTLTVPAGTASGTYTVTYSICEKLNPSNCSIATATIVVGAPAIIANTDTLTIANGANGGTTNSVLTNDSLNGHLNPSTSSVTLTWLTVPTGVQTHTDGTLTVPAGTASGTYTVTYSICEKLNPSNCSTATATIVVGAPAIIANTDTLTIANGANGGTTNSVLTNDSLNGHLNPSTTSVTLTWLTVPTGVQTHTDGTLTVPAGTASGTYTVTYSICEKLNPGNCSTATATIVVHRIAVAIPVAVNDEVTTPINTPIVIEVLRNDTPHGTTPHITNAPANGTAVMNLDNTVTYTPNTNFVGTDTFVYELCNIDGVCVTATVTIRVTNGLTIYNAININGNSQNDHFHIGGIENYPNNTVRIFNRWGVKVFDTEGYDNVRNVFKGFSNGRVTVEGSENLPQGTYYYIIEYIDENGQKESKVGWLYLKK